MPAQPVSSGGFRGMPVPRAITGCAGGRIRVILGETGSDYLYYLDEDDGDSEWQTCNWTVDDGGPPTGLCKQMENIIARGRHITSVDFDCSGQWYVAGEMRDGSGSHAWWGGTSSGERQVKKSLALKYFRQCVNVDGCGPRDFNSHLAKELKDGGGGHIFDVAVARDGCWIVVRENSFAAGPGISSELTSTLEQFYRNHQRRQASRRQQIKAHELRIKEKREGKARRKEAKRPQAEERARANKAKKARLEAASRAKVEPQEAAEKVKTEAEAESKALKRQCDDADNLRQIQAKRLQPLERVTAIGFSSEPGDAIVKQIREHGSVEVAKPLRPEERSFIIKDPRLLTSFHADEDTAILTLLCYASDKFEAAVSMYHCACYGGICQCTKVASANFLPGSILNSAQQRLLTHPPPRPVFENGWANSSMLFDEYKCCEKIDMRRLKEIDANLDSDSNVRASWLEKLNRDEVNSSQTDLKILERCHALEEIVKALISRLSRLPIDINGCVVYEVNYEHRDEAGRGRLFAIGKNVKISNSKYPRTATLQGMQSDLRAALAGRFAHDIDCANSEVRLICSLAEQLGMKDLIPIIFDYRDRRAYWLHYIESVHKVSESDAKRLVNIILSGGRYETWLKSVGISAPLPAPEIMKNFYFPLYSQIRALRDQLLQHPKFKWIEVEREKLKKEGRPPGQIESALMPRIVQSCENEVLGIIHRIFTQHNWTVRAKVFDGLVVEPGHGITLSLEEVNKKAENMCRSFGWDIQLVEKPLHGKVKMPVTIEKARAFIWQLSHYGRG